MIELETLAAFDDHVATVGTLRSVALQGLDLCERTDVLLRVDLTEAVFLGCVVEPDVLRRIHDQGALAFPRFNGIPFRAFRSSLYTAPELFAEYRPGTPGTLHDALDTRVYRWYRESLDQQRVVDELAQRVHDHAIDDALHQLLETRRHRVVAIMGGHGMRRDAVDYEKVVRLARELTRRGYLCASGGGPGAMEAANLGGWLAAHPDAAVDEALAILATAPQFEPVSGWLDAAFAVRERFPIADGDVAGLGIPTWHYGHEPPNVFASHIAKYFANSIREDGLLAIALAGVVFAPGSAGTIQEVFQDAAQNHYESFGVVSPMVFLGVDYWTETKPVYPLLRELSADREYGRLLAIHDDIADVLASLGATDET